MSSFALIIGIGSTLGLLRVAQQASPGESADWVNAGLYILASSLLGSRVVYVLEHASYYWVHQIEAFELWKGGLSLAGALIGGLLCIPLIATVRRIPVHEVILRLGPLVPPLAISGWLGCWLAGCAYGAALPEHGWWGLPAADEAGQVLLRIPIQAAGALFMIALTWLIEKNHESIASRFNTGYLYLLGFAVTLLVLLPLRMDPVKPMGPLHFDLWSAIGLFLLSASGILAHIIANKTTHT